MNDQYFTEVTLRLAPAEVAALKELARRKKRTFEETAVGVILIELIKQNLLTESAERDGSKYTRLED